MHNDRMHNDRMHNGSTNGRGLHLSQTPAMRLLCFVVDSRGQLQRVPLDVVEQVWRGRHPADELGCELGGRLQLLMPLCDRDFHPKVCFFPRLELKDGQITERSRIRAYEAMSQRQRRRYDHPAARWQLEGWPSSWQSQLAVALDVPVNEPRRIGIGGPLLMSDLWGLPIEQVLEYFEQASGGQE